MPTEPEPTTRILVAEPLDFPDEAIDVLAGAGEVTVTPTGPAEMADAVTRYDAIMTRLGTRVDGSVLGTAPRCRVLGVPTTGLDHIDLDACRAVGVEVVSLKGEIEFLRTIRATAEHTLALTLALLRRLVPASASVLAGEWDRDRFRGNEISGARVGVVGMGRLGSIVAELFVAFGADVMGADVVEGRTIEGVPLAVDVRALCRRSDIVTVHVPYAPGDPPALDATAIAALPPGALVVNTSRGGAIDEAALLDALVAGRVGGAALDVLAGEPDVADHPLVAHARTHDNVLVTPHLGGNTTESLHRVEVFVANRVVEALGRRPAEPER